MINVKKLKEISVPQHGIYLSTSPDEIIIDGIIDSENNGLIIFDHDLHKKNTILFPKNDDLYDIYSFFKKFSRDEFLFYCPDEHVLIYVKLNDQVSSSIPLDASFRKPCFSPIYWWSDSLLLLSDYNGNFYEVLLDQKAIIPFEKSKLLDILPDLFEFYHQVSTAWPKTIYSESYRYISKDENDGTIALTDFRAKSSLRVPDPCHNAHAFQYRNGTFLSISEKGIGVISAQDSSYLAVKPSKGYYFTRAEFLNDTTFVTLGIHGIKSHITVYSIL